MNGKIIIIAGYCATGKTTYSQKLSNELNIPCFNKDYIKTILGLNLEINSREDSSRLSVTAYNLCLFFMETLMKKDISLIIESNFKKSEEEKILQLLKRYKYESLTYLFIGDMKIIHERFVRRENLPEREIANRSFGLFDDFDKFNSAIKPLGDFNVGDKIIKIDTSYFQKYIEEAKEFMVN